MKLHFPMPESPRRIIHLDMTRSMRRSSSATIPRCAAGRSRSRPGGVARRGGRGELRGARVRVRSAIPMAARAAPVSFARRRAAPISRATVPSRCSDGDPALATPLVEPLSLDEAYSTSPTISGASRSRAT